MGIYATNYRDRLDISFILYHPQRALVTTRSAKYTNSELMPAGENCIVAIACYTGLMNYITYMLAHVIIKVMASLNFENSGNAIKLRENPLKDKSDLYN